MAFLRFAPLRLLLRGLGLGLVGAILALLLGAAGALVPLERGASNALFRMRGPRESKSPVVLLVIDEATIARAGRLPLPRRFYAQAVDGLRAAGAHVIAFNFVFGSASDDPLQDAQVVRSTSRDAVVQGLIFDVPGSAMQGQEVEQLRRLSLPDGGAPARLGIRISPPLPSLLTPNVAVGHLNVHPEPDGSLARIPHLIRFQNGLYPSLSLAAAMQTQGWEARLMDAMPDGLSVRQKAGSTLKIPLDGNGDTLINWCGGDGTFPTYSMVQLLDGRVPRGALAGATVVVGSNLAGQFTPISTPFSPSFASNQTTLHLQANAIDDLVSGRVLRPLGGGTSLLVLALFSMGAGAVIAPRGAWGALGWTVGASLALWGGALLALFFNRFVSLAAPQIALILTSAACVGVRQVREGRELRLMHEIFDGYVGDDLMRYIKSHKIKLDGEVRYVAVLFCDIRGFSTLAEQMKNQPEALLRLLNDHFHPLVQALKEHGAYVDNYIGDEVMAVFGAPVSDQAPDRNTRSAVLAALELQRLVKRRNQERELAGETLIEIGIGVHCGPAIVGDLGTRRKKHYTAIGDTVNIASRVERETRAFRSEFLVTEDVVRVCRDHPDTRDLPWDFVAETPVKGRNSLLRLYQPSNADETLGEKPQNSLRGKKR